jgi:hypothetical protein
MYFHWNAIALCIVMSYQCLHAIPHGGTENSANSPIKGYLFYQLAIIWQKAGILEQEGLYLAPVLLLELLSMVSRSLTMKKRANVPEAL